MSPLLPTSDEGDFSVVPQRRQPCILLLDTSDSMKGEPINRLNRVLQEDFCDALRNDPYCAKCVDIAIVSFGGTVKVVQDFINGRNLSSLPYLEAGGNTLMGSAILHVIQIINERKERYRAACRAYYRPWIFLLTNDTPTNEGIWQDAVNAVQQGEAAKDFVFFAVGVGHGADMNKLLALKTKNAPVLVKEEAMDFKEMFQWLSNSLEILSGSGIDEEVRLPEPTWGVIQ